jgi:hypothetical protein
MKEKSLRLALLIGAMLGLMVLAFVFDILLQALVERNSTQGGLDQLLVWLFPLLQLLWMVGAVGLVWWMVTGGGFSRWVSVIYMVVGLIVLYSTSFLFVLTLPESFYGLIQYLSPGTFLYQASAAVAAIGLFSLGMWKPATPVEGELELDQAAESSSVDELEPEGADPASSAEA